MLTVGHKTEKMRTLITILMFTLVGLLGFGPGAHAQIPDEIIVSLRSGNSAALAKYFNQNVELVVLNTENVYSKAHAQQVINDFFKKNPPKSFTIIHQGGKSDSYYAIGNLKTEKQNFRIYFLIKKVNNLSHIHQLRIEEQMN